MTPLRGLSISAMRKNAIDVIIGRIKSTRVPLPTSLYPRRRLQAIAIASIRAHAPIGMRFSQAAWVYPYEFRTSFIPETTSAIAGVGCATAARDAVDHSSFCRTAVSASICPIRR